MPSCHSTNDICAEMIVNGSISNGSVVITDHQYKGRGQAGNTWVSKPGENLTLSYYLNTSFLLANQQFYLNMAVSLAILETLKFYIGENLKIKWPNDIYYLEKKVCGILIQNSLRSNKMENSIIGIGININQDKFEFDNAVSLRNITGKWYRIQSIFDKLSEQIENQYMGLKQSEFNRIKKAYLNQLRWINEKHSFLADNEMFDGTITGIDANGRLEIETTVEKRIFNFKELSFVE